MKRTSTKSVTVRLSYSPQRRLLLHLDERCATGGVSVVRLKVSRYQHKPGKAGRRVVDTVIQAHQTAGHLACPVWGAGAQLPRHRRAPTIRESRCAGGCITPIHAPPHVPFLKRRFATQKSDQTLVRELHQTPVLEQQSGTQSLGDDDDSVLLEFRFLF